MSEQKTKPQAGKLKKALGIIINTVLWAALALSILLLFISAVARVKGGGARIFGYGFYQIVSGSMEPELRVGDVIIGKSVPAEQLKTGHNAIFKYNGKLVTHKVLSVDLVNRTVITHGIANPEGANETVKFEDVVGRQVRRVPLLGGLLDFLRKPQGFLLIVALPLTCLIIYQSVSLSLRLKQMKEEKKNKEDETKELTDEIERLKKRLDKK